MKLVAKKSRVWTPQPPDHFTGQVRMAPLAQPETEAGLLVLGVEFSPTARTDWHRHPGGQVLYVIQGFCLVANEEGESRFLEPGDCLQTTPGERHWHGATPDTVMVHLSLTSHGVTQWDPEKVSEEDYQQVLEHELAARLGHAPSA